MDFQTFQRDFTQHIRDPRSAPRPKGVPARRMRVYNELLYNNVEGFLLQCFPVSRRILGVRKWARLVRGFFRDHVSHTPYFRQIPEEFLRYLQDEWACPEDYPAFLPELAHYEWVELALETSNQDEGLPPFAAEGDLLDGVPVVNPVLRVLAYRYPVHRLSPRYKPAYPPEQATFLLGWRDAQLRIHFIAINAATAQLFQVMAQSPRLTGRQALLRTAEALHHPQPEALLGPGVQILEAMYAQGALLGVRPVDDTGRD